VNRSSSSPVDHSFRSFLGATAAILLVALFVAGLRSYRDLSRQRIQQSALLRKIAETELRIEELESRIELLRSDPGTLEKVAREDLGMVRPGDIVLKLGPSRSDLEGAPTTDGS